MSVSLYKTYCFTLAAAFSKQGESYVCNTAVYSFYSFNKHGWDGHFVGIFANMDAGDIESSIRLSFTFSQASR